MVDVGRDGGLAVRKTEPLRAADREPFVRGPVIRKSDEDACRGIVRRFCPTEGPEAEWAADLRPDQQEDPAGVIGSTALACRTDCKRVVSRLRVDGRADGEGGKPRIGAEGYRPEGCEGAACRRGSVDIGLDELIVRLASSLSTQKVWRSLFVTLIFAVSPTLMQISAFAVEQSSMACAAPPLSNHKPAAANAMATAILVHGMDALPQRDGAEY